MLSHFGFAKLSTFCYILYWLILHFFKYTKNLCIYSTGYFYNFIYIHKILHIMYRLILQFFIYTQNFCIYCIIQYYIFVYFFIHMYLIVVSLCVMCSLPLMDRTYWSERCVFSDMEGIY